METDKPDDITDKICDFQSERKESFSSYGRQNELSLQQYLNDIQGNAACFLLEPNETDNWSL